MIRITLATALTLTVTLSGPLAAQLTPLSGELDTSASTGVHALPVAAASADGSTRLIWNEPFIGIHTKYLDPPASRLLIAKPLVSQAAGGSLTVADEPLPNRGSATLHVRHSPALTPPQGDGTYWMVWTEETKWVSVDILFYNEIILDQDVYAGRFGRDGRAIGAPVRVDVGGTNFQSYPSVVERPGGGVLAAWAHGDLSFNLAAGDGIRSRALDGQGRPVGPERALHGGYLTRNPALAANADGRALAVWEGTASLNQPLGIWARTLDAATGALTGEPLRIDAASGYDQRRPSVAALADGTFLVVWQAEVTETITDRPHLQRTATVGRRLTAGGELIGDVFAISAGSAEQNTAPSVVALEDGRAVAAWLTWTPENYPSSILGTVIQDGVASTEVDLSNWRVRDTAQPALAAAGNTVLLAYSARHPETRQAVVATRRFVVE